MDKNIKIYMCDDDTKIIKTVKEKTVRVLKTKGYMWDITVFNNGNELIEVSNKCEADVIFLDIDMPELSGFETAQKLRKIKNDIIIVFITSYEDKVYQSWEYQPFWFVRKSHLEDLGLVITRLLKRLEAEREKENPIIELKAENKTIGLNVNTVMYIESYKHNILIWYDNQEKLQVRCKIYEAEKQLESNYFVRIQNGIIVNCRFIAKVTSRDVVLLNGDKIHIGRDKLDNVRGQFQRFTRSR